MAYPLCSSSSPLRRLPYSRSSQADREISMGFSVLEESVPLGWSFDDGDGWGVGFGKERSGLFGLDDFLLDDPLVGDEPLSAAEPETQGDDAVAAVSVEESKSTYAFSCSSSAAAAAAALAPPLPLSEITLPEHDAAELEWVSRMTDDSQSEIPPYHHAPPPPPATAIVGTNNSNANRRVRPADDVVAPVRAKRSKRGRSLVSVSSSSSWSWLQDRGGYSSNSSSSASSSTTTTSSSSSYSSSPPSQLVYAHHVFDEMPAPFPRPPVPTHRRQQPRANAKPKRRGRKPKALHPAGERRCGHCGVNKTPQWRTGPMGAKTLCNACGVRYKSGRLLPEYRPACSPTFVSRVHSNSHRKVLEMRRKKQEEEEEEDDDDEPQHQQQLVTVSAAPPIASF